ncbi:hypothetical protein N7474_004050 [Penicillium riverlandense]|uniref:uncharacterized protein n=1 Tax=Penicillium riverlandense TaxID=1903569 RepID=UPI0025498BFB|nr:uncharacterized protein N7474_004050 [Penicillium riverlandense]KAJ5818459.1 hypothetical protein N7474_004050 [Penicillium riverlandense]
MPLSDTSDESNMRWQFIDTSKNSRSNLTQVKKHVMQQYMRQKKGSGSQKSEGEDEAQSVQRSKRGRPKKNRIARRNKVKDSNDLVSDENAGVDVEEMDRSASSDASLADNAAIDLPFQVSPIETQGSIFSYPDNINHSESIWSSPSGRSPRTILSAARTDPFNTLPIEMDLESQKLFDFYVSDMPACSYGSHFRSPKAHNWYTRVFVPEAMKGAVAFQNTVLVHAANTWAWVRNETETKNTLLHRDRAVSMLREHLQNHPRDISDVAIISCLSAAALEDFDPRPGHKETSWTHMRAAREMIRARGGPAAFENTRLGMLINWQDYILSGYETHGPSFFFEHERPLSVTATALHTALPQHLLNLHDSIPSPPYSTSSALSDANPSCSEPPYQLSVTPIDEIRLQCEEFLDFLRRCEQLALYQQDNPSSCSSTRRTAVQKPSCLHQILVAPPGTRFTASGNRKQMVARLTALIMLNAALWDYRYTPSRGATFLCTLEQSVIDSEVSMSGSVEALLQILLECNDGTSDYFANEDVPDFSQYAPTATSCAARPWWAGRMLKVAKRLSADSWHRLGDFLFACLSLSVRGSVAFLWEPDLRREILEAAWTSYVMPSLIE